MESEGNGGRPGSDYGGASGGRQQRKSPSRSLLGILGDKILLASWVFSYTVILRVFRVLKSLEIRDRHSKEQKELSSSKEKS
jgi:hypothetical protein